MRLSIFRCAPVVALVATSPISAQSLAGTWTDVAGRQTVTITQEGDRVTLRTAAGLQFTGAITGSRVRLAHVYRTLADVPTEYPEAIRPQLVGQSIRIEGDVEAGGSRIRATLFRHRYDRESERVILDRPTETALVWTRIALFFVDAFGDTADVVTSFSHPHPVVTLDEVRAAAISVGTRTATLTVSGVVTDAIADIVADQRADVRTVTVVWSGVGGEAPDSIRVPVTRSTGGSASALKPYPFAGRFSTRITVPVKPGAIEVAVEAVNVIGNAGADAASFVVENSRVTSVTNHGGSGPGLVNPIRVVVADVSLGDNARGTATVDGTEIPLVRRDGEVQLERPLMAVARAVPAGIPNLVRIAPGGPTKLGYKGSETELHWAYTGHRGEQVLGLVSGAGPPPLLQGNQADVNHHKYAAGTSFTFEVFSTAFRHFRARGIDPLRVRRGRQERDETYSGEVGRSLPGFGETDPSVQVRVQLRGNSWRERQKVVRFQLIHNDGTVTTTASIGRFEAVRLRTIIVAVDGLGYESVRGLGTPYFARTFEGATNRNEYALAALPTITFTNWPGVFSGLPPSRHGIQGNSFFAREIEGRDPFASTGSSQGLPNLGVVRGGFDLFAHFAGLAEQARVRGSLYDNLAQVAGLPLNAWSVHTFYAFSGRARMHAEYFGLDPAYAAHNPGAARLLDSRSARDARRRFRAHRDSLDLLTAYYPGPDNVAHDVGAVGPSQVNPMDPHRWTVGPALPEVTVPLHAIGQQLQVYTDSAVGMLVNAVEEFGYQYATLFVLVSDHGLHAFRNDAAHNLVLPERLEPLFTALGFDVWTGNGGINRRTLVFSPNGGMAHIYLRQTGRDWDDPPRRTDVMRVAGQLYIESLGGRSSDGVAARTYPRCAQAADMATRRCYSALGQLAPLRTPQDQPIGGENGALGNPPAIFVRVCDVPACDNPGAPSHIQSRFRWVRSVDPAQPFGADVELRPVSEFLTARRQNARYRNPVFDWPDFEERLEEMNDTSWTGSRTGDIVVFTDARSGYLAVNDGDAYNGWHGGATAAESKVPLMFNIRDDVVNEGFLAEAVAAVRRANGNRRLRNWQLSQVLEEVYRRIYGR